MSIDYSVIIPAYNEEVFLGKTLRAVLDSMAEVKLRGELIVVDNDSTDRTAEIAREAGASVVVESHRQISRARNAGGRNAQGRFLVFVDADTLISPELLDKTLSLLQSGEYYGGGARIRFDRDDLPRSVRFFTNFWNTMAPRREFAAGSYIYVLKEAFDAVGGFSENIYAAEEIFFSKAIGRWGRKKGLKFASIDSPPVLTSSRKLDKGHFSILATFFLLGTFPFLLYSRTICWPWYGKR